MSLSYMSKIVHVITTISIGGAENQLLLLCKYQLLLGYKIDVVYLKDKPELIEEFHRIGIYPHNLSQYRFGIKQLFQLKKILGTADIVHSHLPRAELACAIIKPSKLVFTRHNSEAFFPKFPKIISRILSKFVCRQSNFGIAISSSVKDYLTTNNEITKDFPVLTVNYGFENLYNSNQYNEREIRNELNINEDQKVIISIGRLVKQKDYVTAFESVKKIVQFFPDLKYLIIGVGELQEELKLLSRTLGIDKNIIWMGKVTNVYKFLAISDCFLFTSRYEGFGLALLEAVSSNVPIVASNISAIPEVLGNDFPLLCEVGNVDIFVDNMLKILDFKNDYINFDHLYSRILSRFSPITMTETISELYFEYCQ